MQSCSNGPSYLFNLGGNGFVGSYAVLDVLQSVPNGRVIFAVINFSNLPIWLREKPPC
jgi:hypothetical protein|tara:strand:+ start:450 stop:623 length:174 start_codon:yes stop_codon:yes gene_type:complete